MLQIEAEIVGMGDLLKSQPLQLLSRVAQDLAQRAVDLQPAAVGRHQRHPDGGVLHGVTEAGFTVSDMELFAPERIHHQRHNVTGD